MTDRELMQQALEALKTALETMKKDWQAIDTETGLSEGGLDAAIDGTIVGYGYFQQTINAITALRERLAQPEQEPVAWMFEDDEDNGHKTFLQSPPSPDLVAYLAKWRRSAWVPLYTTPPQRKPLTDEHIDSRAEQSDSYASFHAGVRFAEAAHGIKGEA